VVVVAVVMRAVEVAALVGGAVTNRPAPYSLKCESPVFDPADGAFIAEQDRSNLR
jgi:hypothetical protein